MPVTREYKCPEEGTFHAIQGPLGGEQPQPICPDCGTPLKRHFGNIGEVMVNYGYRESRYSTKVDKDIAKFQFKYL